MDTTIVAQKNDKPVLKKWRNLAKGDTVIKGKKEKVDGEAICVYPDFEISIKAKPGKVRMLDLRNDSKCNLKVNEKSNLKLSDVKIPKLPKTVSTIYADDPSPEISGYFTGNGWIDMYGYGGTWDKLTRVYQEVNFYYVESEKVKITGRAGSCQVSWTGWYNNYCYGGYQTSGYSDYEASSEWQGGFHWVPFNTYYHSLHNWISGDSWGGHSCSGLKIGMIVAGIIYYCV